MAACANATFQLIAACNALSSLAAVNSSHVRAFAKTVEMICNDCEKECDKFPKIAECTTCGDATRARNARKSAVRSLLNHVAPRTTMQSRRFDLLQLATSTVAAIYCSGLSNAGEFDSAQHLIVAQAPEGLSAKASLGASTPANASC